MLVIHTKSGKITSIEYLKALIKLIIGKKGGPTSVLNSLKRGLDKLNIKYKINSKPSVGDVLIVLSGKDALNNAIKLKKMGVVSKLIAGPNISVFPTDYNSICCDDAIDTILVPAAWVRDLWISINPSISNRIKIWAAGVEICENSTRNSKPIIYNKLKDNRQLDKIRTLLDNFGYESITLNYGNFKQKDYFNSLKSAPFMIYLGNSESQGLAIQEAWACNVPTIVLKVKNFSLNGITWSDDKIAAPYLNDELGFYFDDLDEVKELINECKKINPVNYCLDNLSDTECTKKLMELI